MAEDLGDKTELPTAKRRSDARAKGQVAKSQDLGVAIDLIGALVLLLVLGDGMVTGCAAVLRRMLGSAPLEDLASVRGAMEAMAWAGTRAAWIIGPFALLMFAVAALAQYVQVGTLLTLEPLRPKLNRFNPAAGIKRIVGRKNLVKTGVNIAKLVLILTIASMVVESEHHNIAGLAMLDLAPAVALALQIILRLCVWILVIMLLLGLIDWWFQRWQHTQELKMTKQEVKDELRSMEGDLATKGRRMRMARKMMMQRMQQAVPQADVVVTNPTHFAVAIKYDPKTMEAPRVVAKGADWMAFRIREIAAAHRVPIVEKPALARALFASVEVGRQINPEFYEAVAEILAYVYRLEGRAA